MAAAKLSRRQWLAGAGAAVATAPGTLTSPLPQENTGARGGLDGYVGPVENFTLSNARILVGDGTEQSGGVRVEGGKIVGLGPSVTGGTDLGGAVVFPGFFDGGSPIGLYEIDQEESTHDDSESSDAVVPTARVVDAYNPLSAPIGVARRQGVLGGLCLPNGGLVAGQAAWVRFAGLAVADATVVDPAGLVINFGKGGTGGQPNAPRSRMGVAAKLRELLETNKLPDDPHAHCSEDDKKRGRCDKGKCKVKPPDEPPEYTPAQRTWHAVHRREMKVILGANRADDILTAIEWARDYKLDAVLLGCAEGHLVAPDIAESGFTAIAGPVTVQPSGWDTAYSRYDNLALLHAAGVNLVLRHGGPHQLRELGTEACLAVAYGLPYGAAIAAACGHNARKAWNLPLGKLAVGEPATLAVSLGDPLQPRTRMSRAWIDGREVTLRSRQSDLFDRFRVLW
ncbi:MAG: hypothetical protein FJ102_11940 [Deltaproteobacteria bacterium]|nr:hypothetical protein [Deltaproteobacteria bacterium]